ncbi:MAG: hypothetical protein AAF599_02480 [Bacteroidota bacterium]
MKKGEKISLRKGERKNAEETACKLERIGMLTTEQIAAATDLTDYGRSGKFRMLIGCT